MVPSIYTITPNEGLSSGRRRILITGWGYRLPPEPEPFEGGTWPRTVDVLFNGVSADWTAPLSDTELLTVTPQYVGTTLPQAVDVVVKNLDDNGDPIPTEEVTATDGFTYRRPDITTESPLLWISRQVIRSLKRNLIANVAMSAHPDWSSNPSSGLVAIGELPAIVLTGPTVRENTFYRYQTSGNRSVDATIGLDENAGPFTIDLLFDMLLIGRSKVEVINLKNATMTFFQRRPEFVFESGPSSSDQISVRWYALETEWRATDRFEDQTMSFEGSLRMEGFEFDDNYGLAIGGRPVDSVITEITDDTDYLDVETEALPDE